MTFEGRKYPTNKEKFDLHGSAALIKTERGTLLFQLKDAGAPSGAANKITTFGGKRELHIDGKGHNFQSREHTRDAAVRETMEELSLPREAIKNVSPLGYQSFNFPDNPDKGFSVSTVELAPDITTSDMTLTEGAAIVEGTLDEILSRPNLFEPIREMLERNEDRINKWVSSSQ